MAGQFRIRPESLTAAASQFQGFSDELTQAIETLQAKVLGAGSPWGQDEMGSIFAEAYTECSAMGLQAMQHLAAQLASIAEGLQSMGQNLDSAEQAGQTTFEQIQSSLT